MKRSTIFDIASLLKLSPATVSRALRDHPDISEATKKRILAAAKELDYLPNPLARNLRSKTSSTIGVIVPEIRHDFFASAISGIEDIAYAAGYTIIVCQSNEDPSREAVNVRTLAMNHVAGAIISISQGTTSSAHFKVLKDVGVPFVFFDRVLNAFKASRVVVDDFGGAYAAVQYLLKAGYTNVAHLAGPEHLSISKERLRGYRTALKENNGQASEIVIHGGMNEEDGLVGADKLMKLPMKPDAIFAVNDPVALGAFKRLREQKKRIPEDVAIVGFSNNKTTELVDPPLTTVDQPSYELGKKAAEVLLEQINGHDGHRPRTEVLKTRLIVRGST
jgi:LacI family transcriptional regulator